MPTSVDFLATKGYLCKNVESTVAFIYIYLQE